MQAPRSALRAPAANRVLGREAAAFARHGTVLGGKPFAAHERSLVKR